MLHATHAPRVKLMAHGRCRNNRGATCLAPLCPTIRNMAQGRLNWPMCANVIPWGHTHDIANYPYVLEHPHLWGTDMPKRRHLWSCGDPRPTTPIIKTGYGAGDRHFVVAPQKPDVVRGMIRPQWFNTHRTNRTQTQWSNAQRINHARVDGATQQPRP